MTFLPMFWAYVHAIFLRLIIIPILTRFLTNFVGKSSELLKVNIDGFDGELRFGREDSSIIAPVTLRIMKPAMFIVRLMFEPKIGLGESFMHECWDAKPRPHEFLAFLIRCKRHRRDHRLNVSKRLDWPSLFYSIIHIMQKMARKIDYMYHTLRSNSITGSAENIREHYDLGNDMFKMFLDNSMTYSCAIFEPYPEKIMKWDPELLEKAQMRKYDIILEKMDLKCSDHILEIGCGWGNCAIRAVQKYGCKWTALTISQEQFDYAQKTIKENGLTDRIEIKLLDYRLETGLYDKIISIEMIEAIGHEYLSQFFKIVRNRLKLGGTITLQAITCPNAYYEQYCKSSDFIKKHIFPGGHLPSENSIAEALPRDLKVQNLRRIGKHYVPTLDLWYSAWMDRENDIISLGYPRIFHRKWQFYFSLCSVLFEHDNIDAIQMKLSAL